MIKNGREYNALKPIKIKSMRIFVTDDGHDMKEERRIPVVNGIARFTLAKTSFISLFTE